MEEDVTLYRAPGQRLGLGLRFVGGGGSGGGGLVSGLFVQGCAAGSPSSGALCSWGRGLRTGDEVLEVQGRRVACMTRAQCVKELKGESARED